MALAVRLWDSPELTGAAAGALLKLRAAGVDVDQGVPAVVEPKVRTTEPAFGAAARRRAGGPGGPLRLPPAEPGRAAPAHARAVGRGVLARPLVRGRARPRPGRAALLPAVPHRRRGRAVRPRRRGAAARRTSTCCSSSSHSSDEPPDTSTVRLWLAKDRAAGLRRRATVVGEQTIDGVAGDVVELEVWHPDSAASWIAGYGADAVVLEPEVLRKSVHERLLAVVGGTEGDCTT